MNDFLAALRATKHGKLKVILGMAAGVGKTVAMLREAHRLRDEGVDVACGLLETHGREETLQEVGDLPMIPRRATEYRGVTLTELDVDAVIERRPELVLVDELAHTNAPGDRYDKRYQSVEALLDAGISVMGTLNVQHIESLHGLVLRETGVDVRERVPDRFLRRADEVVVIDLAPSDLIDRIAQGKVYAKDKVDHALRGFFREAHLHALRQIALREVANTVAVRTGHSDVDAVDAERVMVSMSSRPVATRAMLRHGARLAGGLHTRWFVVYVRTPMESIERIDAYALRSLTENIALAKELGAEVVGLESGDVAEALARFAAERNVTHAVFGRTREPTWRNRLFGSVLDHFMRLAPAVDVLVVGAP